MRPRCQSLPSVVVLALTVACAAPESDAPIPGAALSPETPVAVTGGQIRDALFDDSPDVITFKGLPFTAPPVGDLRWRSVATRSG